jgi:hypothetical protein
VQQSAAERQRLPGAQVDVDVQSLLSIGLERSSLSFGQVRTGTVPPPLSEAITVTGNVAAGYSSTFTGRHSPRPTCRSGIATTAPAAVRLDQGLQAERAPRSGRARCRPGDRLDRRAKCGSRRRVAGHARLHGRAAGGSAGRYRQP